MRNNLLNSYWAGGLCLMCALLFNVNAWAAVNISGTVNASTLPDNAEVMLTGNTNLYMDVNKTIKTLQADYPLTLSGGNILTVNNQNGDAITADGDISISGSKLVVKAKDNGIFSANGDISLDCNSDLTSTNGRTIYSRCGNISITGDITAITSSSRMSAIEVGYANNTGFASGSVTIIGSTINVSAVNVAIHAYVGSVSVTGNSTIISSNEAAIQTTSIEGFKETYKSDVTLDGTFHLEGASHAVISGGKLILKTGGSITSVGTLYALETMTLNGDVDVNGGNAQAICCQWGDVTITGNLTAKSTSTSEPCVQAGFADNTGFASGGIIIFGGTVDVDAVTDAIKTHANGGINISGNVTIKSKKGAALHAMAIDLTNISDKLYHGDITLDGTINLSGGKYGIVSGGHITLQSGSLTSVGALYAMSDITINGDLNTKTTRPDVPCIQAGFAVNSGFVNGNVTITGNNIIVSSVTDAIKSHARGDIRISGNANIYSLKGAALYAMAIDFFGELYKGDVILNGAINLNGGQYGIASGGGSITLQSGSLTSVGGLTAMGDITINGDLNAKAKLSNIPCIQAGNTFDTGFAIGNIIINGENILVNSEHDAIKAIGGNIQLTGNTTVTSSNGAAVFALEIEAFGDSHKGDVIFGTGDYNISGKEYSVVSHGAITLSSALNIVSPTNGTVSGYTIVDSSSKVATFVHISAPAVSGSVALSTAPSPGNELGFTLSGDIATAETENVWQISDDDATWQDIEENAPTRAPAQDGVNRARKVASELVYVPTDDQVGKYIRVKVSAADRSGYIYSPSRQIAKKLCTDVPVVPTLTNINDKVYVSNAKTSQEYIIFTTSKDAASLTESDWADAVTPESEVGFFELNSTTNANHTVFTRIKETTSTLASEAVAESRLYIGTSIYLQDVELNISKTVGYFQSINNELNCKVGDVIRCDATPVPSNATNWYGISGSNWTVDYRNTDSPYGTFYEDADCTIPISSSSNYKTVYLKTLAEKNYLDVRILAYNSAIGYKTRYVQFNVTTDGYSPSLDCITNCSRTIAAGEKMTGLEVSRRPLSGSVYGLTTQVSGEGTAPTVSFTLYERMNVDATNATPGIYTYTPIQNGKPLTTSKFTITVTDGKYGVDAVLMREKEITADPSATIELVAQLMPSNSEADIQWTSSNTSVATVLDGIVTIADNAPIGAVATITATANGKSDECVMTVSGEEYGLYVASTQVTSRNRDDILGDGKFSFDGLHTLTINGDYTISNSANLVRNTGIDGLYIDIAQACNISQDAKSYSTLFDLRKNTFIHGKQMTVNGNGVAFSTQGGMTLTLYNANLIVNAIMPFKGSTLSEDKLNIINSHLEVNASGSAAIDYFSGGIDLHDCFIATPEGGRVDGKTIVNSSDVQAQNVIIRPQLYLYDVNDDGSVNVADIVVVVNLIKEGAYQKSADVNNDGVVDNTDLNAIKDIIMK